MGNFFYGHAGTAAIGKSFTYFDYKLGVLHQNWSRLVGDEVLIVCVLGRLMCREVKKMSSWCDDDEDVVVDGTEAEAHRIELSPYASEDDESIDFQSVHVHRMERLVGHKILSSF